MLVGLLQYIEWPKELKPKDWPPPGTYGLWTWTITSALPLVSNMMVPSSFTLDLLASLILWASFLNHSLYSSCCFVSLENPITQEQILLTRGEGKGKGDNFNEKATALRCCLPWKLAGLRLVLQHSALSCYLWRWHSNGCLLLSQLLIFQSNALLMYLGK